MLFYGLDIGSTNTKAVLLDSDGMILDRLNIPSPAGADRSNDASVWYDHFCRALEYCKSKGHLDGQELVCSVTAQGGSFIMLNEKFKPLYTCHWTENAKNSTLDGLRRQIGERAYYHITGWQADNWVAAFKLKELVAERRLPEHCRFLATVPDFLYSQIAKQITMDITNAQITGMCDFDKGHWSSDIINWIGVDRKLLPPIEARSGVLYDKVSSPWGRISFVTGSHDQYAAMQAADIKKDKELMLGTGTVWVINRRTSEPDFDEQRFLIHPGRDPCRGCYGNIMIVDAIGAGFDQLLDTLGTDKKDLPQIEGAFSEDDLPTKSTSVDIERGTVNSESEAALAIRRYMEHAASRVKFMLEKFSLNKQQRKLLMTGGAAKSEFWPQAVADICDIPVKAIDFLEFTAYGAALAARQAATGQEHSGQADKMIKSRIYQPRLAKEYRHWYNHYQYSILEKHFSESEN